VGPDGHARGANAFLFGNFFRNVPAMAALEKRIREQYNAVK